MKLLLEIDDQNYNPEGLTFVRPSARCICFKGDKIAMIHSLKYDYYKFPGGGINSNESNVDALIRETKEEAGLTIIPSSIKEFGYIRRKTKYTKPQYEYMLQDNFYYLCEVEDYVINQNLDDYESDERFTLEYIDPKKAIEVNESKSHGPKSPSMIYRENCVLKLLIKS